MIQCITHNGHYLKICILRSVLLRQFRKFVGLLPTLYKYRGNVVIKHYNIAKYNLKKTFKTNIICVSKLTFNLVPQNHVGLLDKALLTRRWYEWRRRKNRWHIVVALQFFSRNQSANSATWTGFYTGCQLWITEMCEYLFYTNDYISASPTKVKR